MCVSGWAANRLGCAFATDVARLSITALAEELGRNRGSVTRDVNKLVRYGLLRLHKEVKPRTWSGADY